MLLYSVFYGSITLILLILFAFGKIELWIVLSSLFVSSWVAFPILWLFRTIINKYKILPFYIYFDSSEGSYYGDENWLNERGLEKNFITAYKWNVLRNISWNFWLYFRVKSGVRIPIKVVDDTDYDDFREDYYLPCQIKTNEGNFGKEYNEKTSILGRRFIIYKIGKTVYWNWSKAYEIRPFNIFYEFELGYNNKRYLLNRNRKKLITTNN